MATGIFVPAEQSRDCVLVEVNDRHDIEKLIGGRVTWAQHDRDSQTWASPDMDVDNDMWNWRASVYVDESEAAKEFERRTGMTGDGLVTKDCLITGPDLTDAPDRLRERFGAYQTMSGDLAVAHSQAHGHHY